MKIFENSINCLSEDPYGGSRFAFSDNPPPCTRMETHPSSERNPLEVKLFTTGFFVCILFVSWGNSLGGSFQGHADLINRHVPFRR